MKKNVYEMLHYVADEGKVFEWATPRYSTTIDENGQIIQGEQQHLYAVELYLGFGDSIDNYIEIDAPVMEV